LPFFAAAVLAAPSVFAQGLHPDCPADPGNEEQTKAAAGVWFAKGEELIKQQLYLDGVGAFLCAYALAPHPAPIFNAAQAAASAGDKEQALKLLRQYLMMAPSSPLADVARQQAADLEAQGIGEPPPAMVPPPPDPAQQPIVEAEPTAEEEKPWDEPAPVPEDSGGIGPLGTTGWVFFGVGAATVVTGAVLQGLAGKAVKDGEATDDYGVFAEQKDKVDGFQKGAIVCFIAGGLLAVSGIVMVAVDGGGEEPAAEISLSPAPGGLVVGGTF
jgi:hypothetical protein